MTDITPITFTSETEIEVEIPIIGTSGLYEVSVTSLGTSGMQQFLVGAPNAEKILDFVLSDDIFSKTELPKDITLTAITSADGAQQFFQRPSYTGREQFEQISSNLVGTYTVDNSSPTGNDTFNGSSVNTYINADAQKDIIPTTFCGVSCWFKLNALQGSNDTLISLRGSDNNQHMIFLFIDNGDRVNARFEGRAVVGGGLGNWKNNKSTSVSLNVWHHCFTYLENPGTSDEFVKLWIDGVEQTTDRYNSARFNWDTNTLGLRVSKNRVISSPDTSLNGSMSDVYISTNSDFKNHLNAYYTNTNIPEASYDELIEMNLQSIDSVPPADWKGSAVQGLGFIKESFEGNGTDAYVDLSSKLPFTTGETFFGVSMWFRIKDSASNSFLTEVTNTSGNPSGPAFHLSYVLDDGSPADAYIMMKVSDGNVIASKSVTTSDQTVQLNTWYHVFAYIDLATDGVPRLFLDGVEYTNNLYTAGTLTSFNDVDKFYAGGGYYSNIPTPGPAFKANADICDFYWSTDPEFKNQKDIYNYIPQVVLKE